MDILFSIASGLGLRLICGNLPEPVNGLSPVFIGLWEGTLSHLLISLDPDGAQISTDHFLAYCVRLVVDLVHSQDPLRPVAVALWTGVGIFLCQAINYQSPNEHRKRSRRRKASGTTSLPSHIRVYEPPPSQKIEPSSNQASSRPEMPPHERPSTPPSFFLQGEDSEVMNFSPVLDPSLQTDPASIPPRPPSAIAPLLEAASDGDPLQVPASLPTPPATSFSADIDKESSDSGRRLSTIVEAPSGEETSTFAPVNKGESGRDELGAFRNKAPPVETRDQEQNTIHTPTKADLIPLPVPDPYTRQSWRKKTAVSHNSSRILATADTAPPAIVTNVNPVTAKLLLRPYTSDEEVVSDELQTPLNPVSRALLEDDADNVFSENDNDELQTPSMLRRHLGDGQLSPLSLPVQVRLADETARLTESNTHYIESGDDRDLGQLTILNPPRRVTGQSIDAVIAASNSVIPRNSLLMTSESALSSPISETASSKLSDVDPKELYSRGDEWRKKAWEEERRLSELRTEYRKAVGEKRVKDAFMLKGQITKTIETIQKLHEKAAKRYYKARNPPERLLTVDVHGLRVQEAIEITEKAFRDALTSGHGTLRVITGRGLHSKNNLPVLRNALIREMEKQRIPCEQDPVNPGALILSLPL
ncbi:hypothetical protein AX15_003208 [Amanita polypyramis BW_CC]|nr:hypothetical protein AX15_003208 [Amanita polypyramis BW_CC]